MSNFPTNFPSGKSIWIWVLEDCLAGDVNAIIQKCKDNGITSLIIKGADGNFGWSQFTQELVDEIHSAGLKVYSWSYVYGGNPPAGMESDPVTEANLVNTLLAMGVDGHIIDAESEYEHSSNPAASATLMMTTIRQKHPDAFIAYAPFPIVDDHTAFPYVQFNQFCDAVMPQVYWNDWQMSPADAVNWMYQQWSKWQAVWKSANLPGNSLPIVPLGSFYDTNSYTLTPADIQSFIQSVAGYMAVSIWEFAHIIRPDCWNALQANNVNAPVDATQTPANQQNSAQTESVTTTVTPPATTTTPAPLLGPTTFGQEQLPADIFNSTNGDIKTYNGQEVVVSVNDNGTRTLTPYTPPPAAPVQPQPSVQTASVPAVPANTTPIAAPIVVPAKGKTTITVKKDPSSEHGVSVTVHDKVLLDYIEEFFNWLFRRG
jgi:hypothetical protein